MALALDVARRHGVGTFDLTGGSPEMNPHFRWLVSEARAAGLHVMDRLNPTIMEEPGYEWVAGFLAAQQVEAVASLPCYSEANVDEQRGHPAARARLVRVQPRAFPRGTSPAQRARKRIGSTCARRWTRARTSSRYARRYGLLSLANRV